MKSLLDTLLDRARRGARAFFDLLFPILCLACGQETDWLCQDCAERIKAKPLCHCPFCWEESFAGLVCRECRKTKYLDGAAAFYSYADPTVQTIIRLWKYNAITELGPIAASLLKKALEKRWRETILPEPSVIIPLPLHSKRERERGFNQAEILAKTAAEVLGQPVLAALTKLKNTPAQAAQKGASRLLNLVGAFALNAPVETIYGKKVILVDDVVTTGATADAAARLLKENGARSVWILALAYGHPNQNFTK